MSRSGGPRSRFRKNLFAGIRRCPAFKPSLSPAILSPVNERILQSLDATDPNLDQLWTEEAKDRLSAYRRGELGALDFDETLAKHAGRP
jgi:hypothetical protein